MNHVILQVGNISEFFPTFAECSQSTKNISDITECNIHTHKTRITSIK